MHPAIRIAVFLLFTATLTFDRNLLYSALAGLILALLAWRWCPLGPLWRALSRLRWFFLSLLLLGLWLPPLAGDYLSGLRFGLSHIGLLILLVLAAQLLLATTATPALIAALDWLLSPLRRLGLPTARFSLRLALVLDTVREMQTLYPRLPDPPQPERHPLDKIGSRAAELFLQAMHRGETAPLVEVELAALQPPPAWQWLYPLGLLGLAWLCRQAAWLG